MTYDPDIPLTTQGIKRPFWQTKDCPEWCVQEHRHSDLPADRYHFSDTLGVALTMQPGYRMGDVEDVVAERIDVEVFQGYREAEPHVTFGLRHGGLGLRLTLDEVERLSIILARVHEIANDTHTRDSAQAEMEEQ